MKLCFSDKLSDDLVVPVATVAFLDISNLLEGFLYEFIKNITSASSRWYMSGRMFRYMSRCHRRCGLGKDKLCGSSLYFF